jgi:hypothetical protein
MLDRDLNAVSKHDPAAAHQGTLVEVGKVVKQDT